MGSEERTDMDVEKLRSCGLCTLMATHQQCSGKSAYLFRKEEGSRFAEKQSQMVSANTGLS